MILLELFYTFFKIGLFTFGGGYAMIPMITDEVVSRAWALEGRLIDFIAISESTPGPFAINIATFVGMNSAGLLGAICATLGVILPSFIIILIVAALFDRFNRSRAVKGFLWGVRPAVIGLIASAAVSVFISAVFSGEISKAGFDLPALCIAVGALVISRIKWNGKKTIHPIAVIAICALAGIVVYGLPTVF
ncbi:MAG: chromate transporter [Clostridia bacterium]|nr:chromate transporter [Clostridia bacterium]